MIERVLLLEGRLLESPLYVAVRLWGPLLKAEVLKVKGLELWLAVPSGVDPS